MSGTEMTLHRIMEYARNSFVLMLAVVGIILSIAFHKRQPLKSRQFLPFVASLSISIYSLCFIVAMTLTDIRVYSREIGETVEFWCLIGGDVAYAVVMYSVSLNIARFLVLQNLSFNQRNYLNMKKGDRNSLQEGEKALENIRKKVKIAQILTSNATLSIIVVIIFVIEIPIMIGLGLIQTFKISWYLTARRVHVLIYAGITVTIGISNVMIDLFLHRKLLISSIRKYFIERDRLLIRIDMIMAFIGIFVTFISYGISIVIASDPNHFLIYLVFALDLFRFILFFLVAFGGHCALNVMVTMFRTRKNPLPFKTNPEASSKDLNDQLRVCLRNDKGMKLLSEYTRAEFSIENLECWKHIQRYKQAPLHEKYQQLQYMNDIFIHSGAVMAVNFCSDHRRQFSTCLQNISRKKEEKMSPEEEEKMFQEMKKIISLLETEVYLNLHDSFNRLQCTVAYERYKIEREFEKKQLVDLKLVD